jgi:anhydro-N-acetylmuramic acid kinase
MHLSPLDQLTRLATKKSLFVCGIMSGTSLDAIDVALVDIHGGGKGTSLSVRHFSEVLFPEEIREMILANSVASTSNVSELCVLNGALARLYAEAVQQACAEGGIDIHTIDLIGTHGQTVQHLPMPMTISGRDIRSTLQLGNGSMLAAMLGIPVIWDFRSADLALGGQGAPLVPYVDHLLFHSDEEDRIVLNIGGIANFTWIPAGADDYEVRAFDTGPGNMVIDALVRKFYAKAYDDGGRLAYAGRVNPDLKTWFLSNEYFRQPYPKSAGRELFGERFVENFVEIATEFGVHDPQDIIATAAQCTVFSIIVHINQIVKNGTRYSLYVSGGGVKNRFFMEGLRHGLPNAGIHLSDELGVPTDAKEAVCFAVLANEWVQGNPTSLPNATGSSRRALLGAFSPA